MAAGEEVSFLQGCRTWETIHVLACSRIHEHTGNTKWNKWVFGYYYFLITWNWSSKNRRRRSGTFDQNPVHACIRIKYLINYLKALLPFCTMIVFNFTLKSCLSHGSRICFLVVVFLVYSWDPNCRNLTFPSHTLNIMPAILQAHMPGPFHFT